MIEAPLISESLPAFAAELERALRQDGEPALAAQISSLRIVDRCRCGDDFCATFYTVARPKGAWADLGQYECTQVEAIDRGMVILDLVDRRIASVEVLSRDDVREKLFSVIP